MGWHARSETARLHGPRVAISESLEWRQRRVASNTLLRVGQPFARFRSAAVLSLSTLRARGARFDRRILFPRGRGRCHGGAEDSHSSFEKDPAGRRTGHATGILL